MHFAGVLAVRVALAYGLNELKMKPLMLRVKQNHLFPNESENYDYFWVRYQANSLHSCHHSQPEYKPRRFDVRVHHDQIHGYLKSM